MTDVMEPSPDVPIAPSPDIKVEQTVMPAKERKGPLRLMDLSNEIKMLIIQHVSAIAMSAATAEFENLN